MIAGDVLTQAERLIVLDTPLDPDLLLVSSFTASEAISSLFRYEIEMLVERTKVAAVKAKDLIGEKLTVHLSLSSDYENSPRRHFNGIVSRFSQGHADRRFVHYRAEVVPWLWLMTLTHDCRIFQELSTLDIVKQLFDELKGKFPELVAYRDATTKSYTKLDYCVQYRESSFNFISRLLEQDGIFYFFEHDKDKHTLVLADAPSVHKPCPNQATAEYVPEGGWGEFDNPVTSLEVNNELRPGKYTLRDFHMQMPSKTLEVLEPTKIELDGNSNLEVYDYPGEYARRFNKKERQGEVEPEATKLVKLRMEEEETPYAEIHGSSLCRGFVPGFGFKLTGHFDRTVNAKYVLTSIEHVAVQSPWYIGEETDKDTGEPYHNTFACIPDDVPFRPPRKAPKPVVPGTQTAIVVGPSGQEIYTDEFSRIKVQFHWDRKGQKDDKSSCWIRVSQPWAGQGWGSIAVPRIGQEVVVDFLEGDPDQPIIMGKVYNQELMPPYPLPKQDMVSGLKSNSTPGGGGYNEMIMDDSKGNELIRIHAQYDEDTTVEHDDRQTIHNNRTIKVDGTHNETITKDTNITIEKGPYKLDVQANTHTHHVKGDVNETYDSDQSTIVANNILTQSKNAKITIDAKTEIFLHCGQSMMSLKQDGTIVISGQNVSVLGAQTVKVGVGNQNVVCDVQKVATSGAAINSNAVGMHTITGAVVKIN
jgi:type VI secretion system secreted protein VgrG